ncbi:phospholipase DDHD1-like isoform X2 [Oscarella lobularis]|uniref:phospholipase DDHD1-like isoform X2 n=1 Tax=Oscarella lobularis TaxID=121494 RepID=UPI0033142F6D
MAGAPSHCGVRWMYKEENSWKAFCGADSIALEIEHQNKRPGSRRGSTTNDPVVVLGGMLEIDVQNRVGSSIFFKGKPDVAIIRGTWFTEEKGVYQPLPEEDADVIEKEHTSRELQGKISKKSKGDEILHKLNSSSRRGSSSSFVAWYGKDEIWLNKNDAGFQLTQAVGGFLGGKKKGQLLRAKRLRRGWHTVADSSDSIPPVSHLVFVVHGIGQSLSPGSISSQCFQLSTEALGEMRKDSTDGKLDGRVEFLPIEWRTLLRLDDGAIDRITPPGIQKIRKISNLAVMDVLYYTSPVFGAEIMNSVCSEMNSQYRKFVERHPWFVNGGRVSILGHSLGSVISYDILEEATRSDKYKLNFRVENFFAIGSPLSLFWTVRGKSKPSSVILPTRVCKRMFNIYQRSDPVAYRWEPFIVPRYSTIDPVRVSARLSSVKKPTSSSSSSSSSDVTDGNTTISPTTSLWAKVGDTLTKTFLGSKATNVADDDDDALLESEDSLPNERRLPRRYDYALAESFMESTGQYLRAITAHLCYWTSKETLQFILEHTQ